MMAPPGSRRPDGATAGVLLGAVQRWGVTIPDAVAVTSAEGSLTYAQLATRVHRLARLLRTRGVGPERLVGVSGTRSADLVVALLAVIEAGGAYVPLDPAYPSERLDLLVEDAGLDLVVTTGPAAWAPTDAEVIATDAPDVAAALRRLDPSPLDERELRLSPEHPAYVIYTSGSTGQPKGVVVTHACVTSLLADTDAWFRFGTDDVWALFHSYAFDFSVWELWGAIHFGGRLVVVDEATRRSPDDLRSLLRRERVTVLNQTPTAFYQLIDADEVAGPDGELALRVVVFGGEALDLARLASWYERHPDDAPTLVNMYGITETTVHVTYLRLDRELASSAPGSLVGEAIPGLIVHVLDDRLQLVPLGVTGEIYVSGAQLARGYLNRPALTAARFVASPHGPPGERLYRSGDIGRWVRPGVLEHQGRADSQVKVNGFRIEPGEVEAALRRLHRVRDAVVATRPRLSGGGTRLVGYVVLADDTDGDAGADEALVAVRRQLEQALPAHMVPSTLTSIDQIPLTINGKLDVQALPAPAASRWRARGRAPRTPLEQAVVAAFATVLRLASVHPDDDFFAIGGDSLLAVKACDEIRSRLRVELSVGRVHEARTAARLAEELGQLDVAAPRPHEVAEDGPTPLSRGQQRMWALSAFDRLSAAYNVPVAWKVHGPVDPDALRCALTDVVRRHELLRTVIEVDAHGPRPRLLAASSADVPLTVRWVPAARLEDEARAVAATPFDLAGGLPLRAALLSTSSDDHLLVVAVHHVAIDEWSLPVLARDLGDAYRTRLGGAAPTWAPLPVQFGRFARWERARAEHREPRRLAHWAKALRDLPEEIALPADRPRPDAPAAPAGEIDFHLGAPGVSALNDLAGEQAASPFVVLCAGVARVLRRSGAGDDVVLGTTATDRGDPVLDDLIGYFANTVVLRVDATGDPDLTELVGRARRTVIDALDNDVAFDRVVDVVAPRRVPGRHPLFQTMVVLDDDASQSAAPALGAACAERVHLPEVHARFDLEWHLRREADGGFTGRLVYSSARFDRATAQSLVDELLGEFDARWRPTTAARPMSGTPAAVDAPLTGDGAAAAVVDVVTAALAGVLGHAEVGADDDFFALGGDSIIAIQLANALRRAGVSLSPWDIFRLRTAAAMAAKATATSAEGVDGATGAAAGDHGPLPLPPIVHRLREWGGPIERFNQSVLVSTPAGATATQVTDLARALVRAHGGLRLRLHRDRSGVWSLEVLAPEVAEGDGWVQRCIRVVDTAGAAAGSDALRRLVAEESDRAADRLDPDGGTVVQFVWFDAGRDGTGRLLVVAHHLAVDGVSWHVLLDDVSAAWARQRDGLEPKIAVRGTTLRRYAEAVAAQAHRPHRVAELGRWLDQLAPGADLVDRAGPGTVADTAVAAVDVPAELAGPLLSTVPVAARAEVTDVLLAGLLLAVQRWRATRGRPAAELVVELERHGRDVGGGEDVSRTVGWFTAIAPVRLAAVGSAVAAVQQVKSALRAMPDKGLGHGQLRYQNPQSAPLLAAAGAPQVLFNYLGRFGAGAGGGDWDEAPEADALRVGPSPAMGAGHVLAIDVVRHDGAGGPSLEARLTYRRDLLSAADVDALADDWRAALEEIRAATADGALPLAPADLTLVPLDGRQLAAVRAAAGGLALDDVWPLSPLQEGLLFESQLRGDAYTAQYALDLDRKIDPARLTRALLALQQRHPTLRAGFTTLEGAPPIQFVVSDPPVSVPVIDLRAVPAGEREARLRAVMAADRDAPFELTRPPLWRCSIVRVANGHDRLIVNRQVLLWDGWSVDQVTRELLELYAADADESGLARLTATFPDYLRWLRAQDHDAALERWRDELGTAEGASLLFPGARRAVEVGAPDILNVTLDDALSRSLRDAAASLGVTLNSVLNAGLALVLGFCSGHEDVTFGLTVSGRPTDVEGLDRVVGLFLNTVPVRASLCPHDTLADLVRRVHDRRLQLMAHDFVGLAAIQRAVGRGQLFDVLYVLQNFEDYEATAELYRLHGVVAEESEDHTQYPVTLVVAPDRQIRLRLEHRRDVMDTAAAEAFVGRLLLTLEAIAHRPSRRASTLDLLLPGEVDELRALACTPEGLADLRTVADELAATAVRTPKLTALVCGSERLSFAALDARADRLARLLRSRGAGPERVVALGLGRCVDMVVAMMAVLRTGAAYLPLELDHPPARLAEMVGDSGAVLTVARATTAPAVDDGSRGLLVVDDPKVVKELAATPPTPLRDDELGAFARDRADRLERPAYVVYTSGTSGRPKGVVTPHRGLTNMLRNHHERIFAPAIEAAGGRRFRVAHTVSFAFDMSWEEVLWMIAGHEVHVCDETLRRDATALVSYCDTQRIDVVNVTPTYARILLDEGLLDDDGDHHRPPLVMLGGEAISESVWATLRDTPGTAGYNLYGPTEYTINALGGGTEDSPTPTIGRPIAATDALVLDDWLRKVPNGVAGELYLSGIGLARGYSGRPGLTAASFVAAPHRPGERMYRTGDLVRRRPDGNVDYLGRTDDQVKVRGHRVEPAEVAAVLDAHPSVRASAVVAAPEATGSGQRLVAYVVAEPDGTDDHRAALAAHIGEWQGVYDDEYASRASALEVEDYAGWTSSVDGEPIPFEEMHRWRRDIVERIRELRPTRIAELGVGGGLLLAELAADPTCREYWGTDLSPTVIEALRRGTAAAGLAAEVSLRAQPAHDLDGLPPGHFDVVVLNSVVQYLPTLDHLDDVLRGAASLLAPGGAIVVGDVRHHGLLEVFHAAVQGARVPAGTTAGDLRARTRRAVTLEKELVVDPDHFVGLVGVVPGLRGVDVRLKAADDDNELSRYRYDVVLHLDGPRELASAPSAGPAWGRDVVDTEDLACLLATEKRTLLRLTGVPNTRVAHDRAVAEAIASGADDEPVDVAAATDAVTSLARIAEVASAAGWSLTWTWSGTDLHALDAVLHRGEPALCVGTYLPAPGPRPSPLGNDPLAARRRTRVVRDLRDFLRWRLPDHMVPSAVVVVDGLPLTTNGKLDAAALPDPDPVRVTDGREPATPIERDVCVIVADVLGLPSIGADDNFFLLGGHSLLAMRLVARLRADLGSDLRVSDVMAGQTPEAFAAALVATPGGRGGDTDPALAPVLRIGAAAPGPAIFCIHPLFGLSWVYAGLAHHLEGRTIYGLQSALHSGGRPATTIDELARRYVAQVRQLQPDGPYHLLGWSFGGPVAHLVACALQADDADVGALVVLDAVPAHLETWRAAGDERDREYAERYLGPLPETADLEVADGGGVVRLAEELAWLEDNGRATDSVMVDKLVAVARSHSELLADAPEAPRFEGDMIFVGSTADEEEPYTADPNTWCPFLTGTLEVHAVGFPHHRLMTHAALGELGPLVRRLLDRATGAGA